ncbi:MAG: OadG family protein [Firmicutes bacterium]|nr:OadG family protein [Bacillota bacterium]
MIDVLIEGLRTTVLGMGVVFLSLGALYYVLHLFAKVASRAAQAPHGRDESQRPFAETAIEAEAGRENLPEIAAVIASVLTLEGSAGGRVRVRSVKRVDSQRAAVVEEGTEA